MDLRVLKYFLAVAREENITRAAQSVHITQPSLSRQIQQLEEELHTTLFHRGKQRITLTEDGLLLRRRAQELVALAEKTEAEILNKNQTLTGRIAIGSGEFKNSRFLFDAIAAFRREHPQVSLDIYSGNSDNIKEQLENGLLDLGLLMEPVEVSRYEFIRLPEQEEWTALVGAESELAARDRLTPEDLAVMPLFMTTRTLVQNELMNWFGPYADKLNIIATGNLNYNLAVMARSEQGVCINLKRDCHYEGMREIPLYPPLRSANLLVWKKSQVYPAVVTEFVKYFRQYVQEFQN
ncbi:MAG: LysR family transcriptional regulator [Eubacteriales bacterium]|nr:LysR family transcriptional regulator [Eubacteriales bacterium]